MLLEFFIMSIMHHYCCGHHVVVTWGSRLLLHFLKMAEAAALVVFSDVTFSKWPPSSPRLVAVTSSPTGKRSFICLLPASVQTASSDRLETTLTCSGDPPDSIQTTSLGIWLTSFFGSSSGYRPLPASAKSHLL